MTYHLRPAEKRDHAALSRFLTSQNYLHRHLDWRDTLEWLGHPPFYVLEDQGSLAAALACPPEPPETAWVRVFCSALHTSPDRAWRILFERSLAHFTSMDRPPMIVSLALKEWFEGLLQRNHFEFHQHIVVFQYDDPPPAPIVLEDNIIIRELAADDLAQVLEVDRLAFEPIWRLSQQDLLYACKKSVYMTVALLDGRVIGYQMSAGSGFYAHLSRLAAHPSAQRRRIGKALVHNLLNHFLSQRAYWGVTLNTQHNNAASIALYHQIGFRETGEKFPVYVYPY